MVPAGPIRIVPPSRRSVLHPVRLVASSLGLLVASLLWAGAAVAAARAPGERLWTRLTPCVLLEAPVAGAPAARAPRPEVATPLASGGIGRVIALEALAGAVSSVGFLENGGRVKAGLFGAGALLVTRDLFETRPVTATRGHLVTIVGLAALAVGDLAMEHDGASRGRVVLVDFAALNAIALAARFGARE